MPTSAWGIRLGMMNYNDKGFSTNDYKTINFGVNYNYADNVRFSLENSRIDLASGKDYSEVVLTGLVGF